MSALDELLDPERTPFRGHSQSCVSSNRDCDCGGSLADAARAELAALRDQVETLRLQLAGCGVIAMANTRRSAQEVRNGIAEKYKCASLDDVCSAVDREIDLRERVAKLEAALVKADEMAKAADTATVWRDKETLDQLDLALAAFAEVNPVIESTKPKEET